MSLSTLNLYQSFAPRPVALTVRCGVCCESTMFVSKLTPQLPRSRSCAVSSELWKVIELTREEPRLPLKQLTGLPRLTEQPEFESSWMKPSPITMNEVGSITSVEPPVWITSTDGVVLSVTSTSCGETSVELPWPATQS